MAEGGEEIVFDLSPGPVGQALAAGGQGRGGLFGWLIGRITDVVVTHVLRFTAGKTIDAVINHIEGDVPSGLVSLTGASGTWIPGRDIARPEQGKPILLMFHGTFSTTVGTFAQLEKEGECAQFLSAVRDRYGAVLGYDHRTLAQTPLENATAFLNAVDGVLPQGATIDAVAFSRGGLVYRTLAEQVLPQRRPDLVLRKAVFVGCTNGGTELANPENWEALADAYTNAILGGARAVAYIAGGALNPILVLGIKTLGKFVQAIAQVGVTQRRAPGLAAMEPKGDIIRALNTATGGEAALADYYALTSDFKPTFEWRNGLSEAAQIALDRITDRLIGKANDLVVHTPGMTEFGTRNAQLRDTYAFAPGEDVYHTIYFSNDTVARQLRAWLID